MHLPYLSARRPLVAALGLTALSLLTAQRPAGAQATLLGRAVLAADTFAPGPTSGQFITASNGVTPPFVDKQSVQGFSALLNLGGGDYIALTDNGFGSKANSADNLLRFHKVHPNFKTASGGSGSVDYNGNVTLRDPDKKIPFTLVADQTFYPNGAGNIAVDLTIKTDRLLTGSDFDVESIRRAKDGTLWFGEEFGPMILHTDNTGKVLDAPFTLADVASPDDPFGRPANLGRSRGFEGMALNADASKLYTLMEGPLTTDPDNRRLRIDEFDLGSKGFTGKQFFYQLAQAGFSIGDMTAVNENQYLVIERDQNQGAAAQFKKVFLVDFSQIDAGGFVQKTEIADLLNIADPNNIGGSGTGVFTFPFTTIESVVVLNPTTIALVNDNNYPFSAGRTPNVPDNNEFIQIGLSSPLTVNSYEVRLAANAPEPSAALLLLPALPLAALLVRRRKG